MKKILFIFIAAFAMLMCAGFTVNVKDYGATGNGVTDDTLQVSNAIKTLGYNDTLYFPSGTYIISNNNSYINCKLTSNINVIGDGIDITVLKMKPGTNQAVIKNNDEVNGNYNIFIRDLTIDGNYINNTATNLGNCGVYVRHCDGFIMQRVKVVNSRYANIQINNSKNVFLVDGESNYTHTNAGIIINGDGVTDAWRPLNHTNGRVVQNYHVTNSAMDGIICGEGWTTIDNCVIHKNGRRYAELNQLVTAGIYSQGLDKCNNNIFINNKIFDEPGQGIDLNGAHDVTIDGNDIHDNGYAGIDVYSGSYNITIKNNEVYDNVRDISLTSENLFGGICLMNLGLSGPNNPHDNLIFNNHIYNKNNGRQFFSIVEHNTYNNVIYDNWGD